MDTLLKLQEERKNSFWQELNPRSLWYEAWALPLCYNPCPYILFINFLLFSSISDSIISSQPACAKNKHRRHLNYASAWESKQDDEWLSGFKKYQISPDDQKAFNDILKNFSGRHNLNGWCYSVSFKLYKQRTLWLRLDSYRSLKSKSCLDLCTV